MIFAVLRPSNYLTHVFFLRPSNRLSSFITQPISFAATESNPFGQTPDIFHDSSCIVRAHFPHSSRFCPQGLVVFAYGMNSDDDYYVELYERHAEARNNRRGRRQSFVGPRWLRRPDLRKMHNSTYHKFSQPRAWLARNGFRISSTAICVFLVAYELVFLRGSITAAKETTDSQLSLATHGSQYGSIPRKQPSSVKVLEQKNWQPQTRNSLTSSVFAQPADAPVQSRVSVPSAVAASEDSSTLNLSQKPSAIPAESSKDAHSTISEEIKIAVKDTDMHRSAENIKSTPRMLRDTDDSTNGKLSHNFNKQATKRLKRQTKQKSVVDDADDAVERALEAQPADAASDVEKSSRAASENDSGKESLPLKRSRKSQEKSQAKDDDRRAEPGVNENFWKWFQDSKGSENASSSGVECPEDAFRLCQMYYKILRKYKVRSVFDASCAKNISWMPGILQKLGNEIWGFKYYCNDATKEDIDNIKGAFDTLNFVEFDHRRWWRAGFPEDVELVFAWDVLAHTAYGRVWSFFVNIRKQDIKYILVDNYPGISNHPSPKRMYINLRKHPFRFPAAKDVVQNVTELGETASRQLLFYETSMLPENLG